MRYFQRGWFKRFLVFLLLAVGCPIPCVNAYETFKAPPQLQPALLKLDQRIKHSLNQKQIPGCAVAVVYQNKVVFIKAYGDRTIGQHQPMDIDTVFQLGSVSKPLAATLLSILEEKGHLRLEDPVHYYLKDFSSPRAMHPLKIKHILSHSTGIPRAGFNQLIESHTPYPKILQKLKSSRTRIAAGKHYDYNNAMYGTLSDITHAATRLPFKEALRRHLLSPLKMNRTTTTLQGLLQTENRAIPHVKDRQGRLMPCQSYSNGYYAVAPAGGINSSVRDMSTFLGAQMGAFPDLLSTRMLYRIHHPQVLTQNVLGSATRYPHLMKNGYYALGWRVTHFAHHKLVFHGGWVKGFTNFVGMIPEHKIGIVILHNSESKFSSKVGIEFFESFLNLPTPRLLSSKPVVARKFKSTARLKKISSKKNYHKKKAKRPKQVVRL